MAETKHFGALAPTDLVVAINHEVQAKELKAMLPPHWVQLVEHSAEGMGSACLHLGHQVLVYTELQKQQQATGMRRFCNIEQ